MHLGFKSDASLSANKPEFDWQCQFLFQEIEELFNKRMMFKNSLKFGSSVKWIDISD